MAFATGKYAYFYCDQCGWKTPYLSQKEESTKMRVCLDCFDKMDLKNHPQNKPPPVVPDPEALRNPRPDNPGITWAQQNLIPWQYSMVMWYIWGPI